MTKFLRLFASILCLGTAGAANAVIIDLNSLTNDISNPVTISGISASSVIDITPVGIGGGGLYDAWNAWGGAVVGCNGGGENCSQGWIHNWSFFVDADTSVISGRATTVYATPGQALAAAGSRLGITGISSISFFIPDSFYADNIGGVSLNIEISRPVRVPEPGGLALFGAAFALLGLTRRRISSRTKTC